MERLSDILRRHQTRINTSAANTDTWSKDSEPEENKEPVCPICQGVGFIYANVPVGHPDFGKAVPCRCTLKESSQEQVERLLRYSNLGQLKHLSFENMNPEGKSENEADKENFKAIYQAARDYADNPSGWLVLTGPSGFGKTHLACAIANECLKKGLPAFYITTPDLLERMRSSYGSDNEIPEINFFQRVCNASLLVLDDLGVQSSTPWAKEKLDQLINHRFAAELPTVIVTIKPPDELEERIRTRLAQTSLCRIYNVLNRQVSRELSWNKEFVLQSSMTFENFEKRLNLPREQQENLKGIVATSLSFAQSPDGWLVLQGTNGCGKTHLAAAIVNYRYQHQQPALFIVVPEFLDHLRATFSPESTISYDSLFESVKRTPLLILDDYGEQSGTPWAQEKLYQVLNSRYNSRLPTVITTCKSLDEIENRVSSRLIDHKLSMVWNIMAPDYRGDRPQRVKNPRRPGRWDS